MREALRRFVKAAWGDAHVVVFSIPARPDEDADFILGDAITELLEMRVLAERAEQEAARLRDVLRDLAAEVRDPLQDFAAVVDNDTEPDFALRRAEAALERARAALAEGEQTARL